MTYVGVGRRFVAAFVDGVLLLILSGPFAEFRHGEGYLRIELQGRHLFWPSLIGIAYFVLLEGIAGGTIGKFATGIRVVNEDGTKLGWSSAIVRNVARVVDAFPYGLPYLVGAISVWVSPKQQRLGDRWANTVVVTKESVLPRGSVTYPGATG
ncbi:MAG: RDD family protein, partial [Actinomycetota bacterium]